MNAPMFSNMFKGGDFPSSTYNHHHNKIVSLLGWKKTPMN